MLDVLYRGLLFITNITGCTSDKYSWKSYPVQRDFSLLLARRQAAEDHLRKKQNARNIQRGGSLRELPSHELPCNRQELFDCDNMALYNIEMVSCRRYDIRSHLGNPGY